MSVCLPKVETEIDTEQMVLRATCYKPRLSPDTGREPGG